MINQEILDNAPDWATIAYDPSAIDACKMSDLSKLLRAVSPRSLADIKRIVELEETLSHCKVFLEEMHYLEVNETIRNSQELHTEVSKKLKEQVK
tara:strand:+ start:90 stop:374 length:285 start_codon:yes stop_codon:yes gene_type:complete